MRKDVLFKLSELSEEEKRILGGATLDHAAYFSGGDKTISAKGLFGMNEIGIRRHTRFVDFPTHKHSYLEAMVVLSGNIVHTLGDERITLGRGDILFLNKHIEHGIMKTGVGDVGVNISLTDAFLSGVAAQMSGTAFFSLLSENAKGNGEGRYLYFSAANDPSFENLAENIILELLGGARDSIAAKYVEILMQYLARESERLLIGGESGADKRAKRMKAVSEYIMSSCMTATLVQISSQLYLCPPYLSKLIKEYFGKSFKELVVDEKMSRAHRLIVKTDMNIGDVIRSVGYDNESYFHKEFKKRYGDTPLAERRKLRDNTTKVVKKR